MLCAFSKQPVSVILDTDISSDVDDVGAVAVLHSLADRGEARILAMMVSSKDPWSASCLSALNTFFKRPDIPIGTLKGTGISDYSKYTRKIAQEYRHNTALDYNAPDAVTLYRRILSSQPDHSVVVISIGYLTNLNNLLRFSRPGMVSGRELVKRKVKAWVCMGGQYPKGKEWNFFKDPGATRYVVKNWPTKVVFSGFELGVDVLSGKGLRKLDPKNPLRRAYELYNGIKDRPSWDQIAVFYGVRGSDEWLQGMFSSSLSAQNVVSADGSNVWRPGAGRQTYLQRKIAPAEIGRFIERIMLSSSLGSQERRKRP